ncbi:MAG: hypothetical protein ACRETN_06190 [Nevskiales bacterium]
MAIVAQALGSGERTRQALLLAGAQLLQRGVPCTELTVSSLAQAAQVAPGAYYLHFDGLEAFQLALLRQLLDEVRAEVTQSMTATPPGKHRLQQAVTTYFDASLQRPALRTLLRDLHFHAAARDLLRTRARGYTTLIRLEFELLRWPQPAAAAHLYVAMTTEIVMAELEAGAAQPELRHVMFGYLDRH